MDSRLRGNDGVFSDVGWVERSETQHLRKFFGASACGLDAPYININYGSGDSVIPA